MNVRQLRHLIIRPALQAIRLHSEAAEHLVVGTALVESGAEYIDQVTNADIRGEPVAGPALGLFQMEQATHDWLARAFDDRLVSLLAPWPEPWMQLAGNVNYAAAMCRLRYFVDSRALPAPHDAWGMALYHKRVYNTVHGKTDPRVSVYRFGEACGLSRAQIQMDSRGVGDV